jgi:GNAT superfamily N-acetyltransferase
MSLINACPTVVGDVTLVAALRPDDRTGAVPAKMAGVLLTFTTNPPLTETLRDRVIDLWQAASNAGGAIGLPAGNAERDAVALLADASLAGVAQGHDLLCVAEESGSAESSSTQSSSAESSRAESSSADSGGNALTGMFFLCGMRFALSDHQRLLKRLIVRPDLQGHGYGRQLLTEAARLARDEGAEGIRLTARGGLGLERFYVSAGYREVGRYPGALRVAPGDDRDEIHFWLPLTETQQSPARPGT